MTRSPAIFWFFLCLPLAAQDAKIGVTMPVTLSANFQRTERLQTFEPEASTAIGGFRAMLYPTAKLGDHWFAYSAFQVNSEPYFYYSSYYPTRDVEARVLQLFGGYTWMGERKAFSVKAGKLPSAFGSFPLRYDDTANPLLDVPLNYGSYSVLRADQLPCGVQDLLRPRSYKFVRFSCGGSTDLDYGVWPVSMYGIVGGEIDLSYHRIDARFQLTNSSPAYPLPLNSGDQHVQWTAGAAYTIRQGFRVGFSAYRGPFLEEDVADLLPQGQTVRDYPATAVGVDVQWASGRWSTTGEWQRFQFDYPGFRVSPAISAGYVEGKSVLTPRFYTAFRFSFQNFNRVEDQITKSPGPFQPNRRAYELAVGFHLNHMQTLKVGYEWLTPTGFSGRRDDVFGLQLVTSINSLSKALK